MIALLLGMALFFVVLGCLAMALGARCEEQDEALRQRMARDAWRRDDE